ncbi:MAG TPA: aminomethyl-transferring glycine dehydrogenase subunit GcvPB, partial [Candidatus Limnocylindria bacterium]|nr:aminomethyl-transferring glycine dehydrogenase subunit GcvPB [Candidatus Limnocylindria bacterium]
MIFERSGEGRRTFILPASKVKARPFPDSLKRSERPRLPQMSDVTIGRHYTALAKQAFGVNSGFYPLGSCT